MQAPPLIAATDAIVHARLPPPKPDTTTADAEPDTKDEADMQMSASRIG